MMHDLALNPALLQHTVLRAACRRIRNQGAGPQAKHKCCTDALRGPIATTRNAPRDTINQMYTKPSPWEA